MLRRTSSNYIRGLSGQLAPVKSYSLVTITVFEETMTMTQVDVDGLDNPERAKLLSVVDEFRALGISKDISLPQVSWPEWYFFLSFPCADAIV